MLTRLRLHNFKNFRDAELTLGGLSVIVGTNASGKSNIRDAFRFLHGVARGYTDAGFSVGVYSTPSLYRGVVGGWSLGGVAEWRAAGQTSRAEALRRCRADWSIQGGPAILAQWVAGSRDHDVACPGTTTDLSRWFSAGSGR